MVYTFHIGKHNFSAKRYLAYPLSLQQRPAAKVGPLNCSLAEVKFELKYGWLRHLNLGRRAKCGGFEPHLKLGVLKLWRFLATTSYLDKYFWLASRIKYSRNHLHSIWKNHRRKIPSRYNHPGCLPATNGIYPRTTTLADQSIPLRFWFVYPRFIEPNFTEMNFAKNDNEKSNSMK